MDADENDFHIRCNKKAKQAKAAAQDFEFIFDITVATWAGEPLEGLFNATQHMENMGKCLLDLTYKHGPLYRTERELVRRASSSPETSFGLEALINTYDETEGADLVKLERTAFATILDETAQFVSRVVWVIEESPYDCLQLRDSRNSIEETEALYDKLKHKHLCDLDPYFGRPIGEAQRTNPTAWDDVAEGGLLDAIIEHAQGTNFMLERLLSLIRASCARGEGHKPRAARVLATGTLGQYLRRHLNHGLPDKRGKEGKQDLIKRGVNINCNKCSRI